MTVEGTNLRYLASTQCYGNASCGGDCSSVVFDLYGEGGVWKVPMRGGEPVEIIQEATKPAASPDGTKIACFLASETPAIAIYPADGGSPLKTFPAPHLDQRVLRWTPDGKGIVFINTPQGVSNLWVQPLEGGPAKQITNFDADQIFSFDWSKDGKIAVARGKTQNDVMLITTETP